MDEDRYRDILKLIGDQRVDFQKFETSVLQSQAEHWRSVTIAIRTLTDWWVKYADEESAERKERQAILDERLAVIQRDQGIIQHNQRIWLRVAVASGLLALGLVIGYLLI